MGKLSGKTLDAKSDKAMNLQENGGKTQMAA